MRMDMKRGEKRCMIEEEKMEKVDLSGLALAKLPNPSMNVALISQLDISNNNLECIPESLTARMLNLVTLDVRSNQLRCLPNSIGCLSKLRFLNVSGNMLDSFPKTIENCRALEELSANFNKLTKLPDNIGLELHSLRKLSVNSNKLAHLPPSISHLTNLRTLDARLNCLRALPEDLENLINLEVLNISQNFHYLSSLPYSVGFLLSLVELDVSYNHIAVLPNSIGCLKRLQKLHIEGNPLVSPPPEIAEQELEVVKGYLCDLINNESFESSPTKKKTWFGKLVRYGTFNGRLSTNEAGRDKEASDLSVYHRSIEGVASPRYLGRFSSRFFSSRNPQE